MKDKILKLCRRLKKTTIDELVSFTDDTKEVVELITIYLENEGHILIKDNSIIYIEKRFKKGEVDARNINIMFEYRTPQEIEIIIKGFCSEISIKQVSFLVNVCSNCIGNYYAVFRKKIYDRQFRNLYDYFTQKPQCGRYRNFFNKQAYFYVYNNNVFVSERLLRASTEKIFTKEEIREFKIMYSYLSRLESHNNNEVYMFHRLAEYIWRRSMDYEDLYKDLKNNLLNIS